MKKYLLPILAFFSVCVVNAQYTNINPTPTFTPKSTPIEVLGFNGSDWSSAEKTAIKDDVLASYPGTVFLGDATKSYNCHNFAWHLSKGGGNIHWMNQTKVNLSANIQNYWTDGSYIEVCNSSQASTVFYFNGDHSAIISPTVSGMYESKWGALVKVRHSPTNVPSIYVGSNRKYYASTDISGVADPLCSGTRVLSAPNITGATYTWSVNGTLLSIVSGQGTNQLTV
jgi:hypothetical protein